MNETNEYYGFTCNINSIQMADTITATYCYKDADGNDKTVIDTCTVEEYLNKFTQEDGAEIFALIQAINDYGYYAQQFLSQYAKETWTLGTDHKEMAKVNTTAYEYTADDLSGYAIRKELNDDLAAVNYSLTLDTDTAINLFFTPAQGYTGGLTAKLSNGKELKVMKTGGRYRVTIPGISAHLIGKTYDLVITTETNGQSTVSVSALSYAYACMEEGDPARTLMSAFYDYYLKALAYKSFIDGQGQP